MSNEREFQKETHRQKEIRRILRLLETTARIVETSAITDHFSDGEERCARQFNNALNLLADLEAIPDGLFELLETDASFGDICFACHQVSAYVREGCVDDFDSALAQMKKTIGGELKDVSEVVRLSMPTFLKDIWKGQEQDQDVDTVETVEVTSDEDEDEEATTPVEERIARLEGQMETVVEILQEIRTQQQNDES